MTLKNQLLNNHQARTSWLLVALLLSSALYAQEDTSNAEKRDDTANTPAAPTTQEVEANEDVYRQFMELRDVRQQRIIMPEDAYKASSGSQKLDELPEESQKHLRNQLREIILGGDPWQPGDENKVYPYVPSAAAAGNPELQKQEAEAWGELLDSYHRREAQIYENASRTAAAMAPEGSLTGSRAGSPGAGAGGASQAAENAGQQAKQDPSSSQAADDIPRSSPVTRSSSARGVSQNAMEFLQRMGSTGGPETGANQAENGNNEDTGTQSGVGGPLTEPTPVTRQSDSKAMPGSKMVPVDETDVTASSQDNAAGESQNAMNYLASQVAGENDGDKQESQAGSPPGDNDDAETAGQQLTEAGDNDQDSPEDRQAEAQSGDGGAPAGTSQNALEYLGATQPPSPATVRPVMPGSGETSGTISIEDLVNAQGVGARPAPGANTAGNAPGQPAPPKKPPEDKDGN